MGSVAMGQVTNPVINGGNKFLSTQLVSALPSIWQHVLKSSGQMYKIYRRNCAQMY
jgi:hypothetical protein